MVGTLEGVKVCVDDQLEQRRGRARLRTPPLNVSHKGRFLASQIPFSNYEGVITVA